MNIRLDLYMQKYLLSDDDTATVGSINLDYRSLYLHFECGVFHLLIIRWCVIVEEDFQETLAKCQKVTMTEVRNRSTSYENIWSGFKTGGAADVENTLESSNIYRKMRNYSGSS